MRKLLALLLACLLSSPAFAGPLGVNMVSRFFPAIGASAYWDIKTTGVDTNGGCFVSGVGSPGTDESQGSGTSITITLTGTTTGTASPAFTSTTHGPGNCIHIASGTGCTTGWYVLNSQSAGTGTFDRAMGSNTDVCVGTIGGSMQTPGAVGPLTVAGNSVGVQAGTYTVTSTTSIASASAWIGYQTTHGDGGTKPLITTATNSTNLFQMGTGNSSIPYAFQNLSMSNTAATRAVAIAYSANNDNPVLQDSKLSGFTIGIDDGAGQTSNIWVINSECTGSTSACFEAQQPMHIIISNLHDNPLTGGVHAAISQIGQSELVVIGSLITANGTSGTGEGIAFHSGNTTIVGNTIANNQGDNVDYSGFAPQLVFVSNLDYGSAAGWGVDSGGTAANFALLYCNGFGNNSSGNARSPLTTGANPVTITANPFNNAGSGDFSLNSTAGGGAALKGVACPLTSFSGGLTPNSGEIGASQSAASAGSTSSVQTTVQN